MERYEIRVKSHLGPDSIGAFEGFHARHTADGETVLTGPVADQAALHGLLMQIRDLGLPLLEVKRVRWSPGQGSGKGETFMSQEILVLGGTGMLGEPVARLLQARGHRVRVLARDAEKARALLPEMIDVVPGDVTDLESLEAATRGCSGVHISVGGPVDQLCAENVASLAHQLGVERLTYVSGSTVKEQNSWFPMTRQKLLAEQAIRNSGVPYTIFCPTWPMEQLPRFVVGGRAMLVGALATPWHWFAAEDLARMVVAAYEDDAVVGKRLTIHGPAGFTMEEALKRYCQVFHPEVETITVMPIEAARAAAKASGNQMLGFFAELMAYFQQVGEPGDPAEANRLLGAPATTLAEWLEDRKERLGVAAAAPQGA